MAIFSVTDCCSMLGVDIKTLRSWLKRSQMQFVAHPVDARRKCLSEEQVRLFATLHHRPVPFADRANPALVPELAHGDHSALPSPNGLLAQAPPSGPPASLREGDLIQKLAALEARVTTMHEQLTQLALQFLQERNVHYEQRLSTLEALLAQQLRTPLALPGHVDPKTVELPPAQQNVTRRLHPAEQHARSRVLPLIEYGAQGRYVAICSKEGVLAFQVDSAQWFDWLATLASFHFVGPVGHFTAYRNTNHGRRNRTWVAHRHVHGRTYRAVLGVTNHLTIACLEQAAAQLHAHLTEHYVRWCLIIEQSPPLAFNKCNCSVFPLTHKDLLAAVALLQISQRLYYSVSSFRLRCGGLPRGSCCACFS